MPMTEGRKADAVPSVSDPLSTPPGSPSSISSTSTADDAELSSPVLPALPAPQLPERAQEYLRTPPGASDSAEDGRYVTTSWGSPYQQGEARHFRQVSSSSELSGDEDDSELALPHQLAVNTRFLRPAPLAQPSPEAATPSSLTGSAAVLANRARRPVLGLTEDWIRTHTTEDPETEYRHWLSDTDESEHSLLSGSQTPDETSWLEEVELRTPRAQLRLPESTPSAQRHQRARSSNETLRQALTNSASHVTMDAQGIERVSPMSGDFSSLESSMETSRHSLAPAATATRSMESSQELSRPATPPRPMKPLSAQTPRLKKKVPWRGKNIMVLLPRDEERGQPGRAPKPMTASNVKTMLRDWEELGYNVRGFDLDMAQPHLDPTQETSQSRGQWPAHGDVTEERAQHAYQVTLPDLDGKHVFDRPKYRIVPN